MDNSIQEMGPNIYAVAENTDTNVPKKIGAPRRGPNNTRLSDDVEHYRVYHRNYYRNKLSVKIKYPLCHRMSCKDKLSRHQKSKRCLENRINSFSDDSEVNDDWVGNIVGVCFDSDEFDKTTCN